MSPIPLSSPVRVRLTVPKYLVHRPVRGPGCGVLSYALAEEPAYNHTQNGDDCRGTGVPAVPREDYSALYQG